MQMFSKNLEGYQCKECQCENAKMISAKNGNVRNVMVISVENPNA